MVLIRARLAAFFAAALIFSADLAWAQNYQKGRLVLPGESPGFGLYSGSESEMTGRLTVVSNEKVQQELKLTSDQVGEIQEIWGQLTEKSRELRGARKQAEDRGKILGKGAGDDANRDERFKRLAEVNEKQQAWGDEAQTKVDSLLSPSQVQRSKEIHWQLQRVAALQNQEVAEALAIREDQFNQMSAIGDEFTRKSRELFEASGLRDLGPRRQQTDEQRTAAQEKRQAYEAKLEPLRKEAEEKIFAVLSDEQKKKFEELKGAPYAGLDDLRSVIERPGRARGREGRRAKAKDAGGN